MARLCASLALLGSAAALVVALFATENVNATFGGASSLSFLANPKTKLLYPDTFTSALSRNISQRVAIVGAGAAGLTAAATLQQLGYRNVVVFESAPRPGGKCFTVEVAGAFYDLGAIQVSSAYWMVASLAAATKTPLHRFAVVPKNETAPGGSNNTATFAENVELVAGVPALAATTKRFWREITAPGMLQASENPAMAGVTFSEFAQANKFGKELTRSLTDAMTGFGYSYASTTPAAFWMRLVSDLGLKTAPLELLFQGSKPYGLGALTFDRGYQSLWENVEKEITTNPGSGKSPVQVRTSTKVVAVTRGGTGGGVQVSSTASGAGSSVTENFDRIIVTSPLQTAASFMQLTPQETKWFSQIKTVRYLVTLAEPPVSGRNSPAGAFFTQNMVPSRANHAVALGVQNRRFGAATQRSLRTFYQILDDAITTAAATEILKQDALELTGVPLGEIKAQRNWEGDSAYFPHLSSESMGAGWYKDVEAAQGQQGTFWAGSVMSFEDVERTSIYANYLALRWF